MTTVSSLPTLPERGNPATFNTLFEGFLSALKNDFVGQVNAVAGEVNAATAAAALSASNASTAQGAAVAAAASAALSAGSSFKGAWSGLSGALAVPATVAHNGLTWVLLSDVANVAAAVPGVSASWQCLQKGVIQVVAASTSTPFSTTSTSYVDAGLSAVITPKSNASKILALLAVNSFIGTGNEAWAFLYRGAVQLPSTFFYAYATSVQHSIAVLDSPASASPLTYSLKAKIMTSGTVSLPRTGGAADSLIMMEIL